MNVKSSHQSDFIPREARQLATNSNTDTIQDAETKKLLGLVPIAEKKLLARPDKEIEASLLKIKSLLNLLN